VVIGKRQLSALQYKTIVMMTKIQDHHHVIWVIKVVFSSFRKMLQNTEALKSSFSAGLTQIGRLSLCYLLTLSRTMELWESLMASPTVLNVLELNAQVATNLCLFQKPSSLMHAVILVQ
jgi:hypothetical protein